MTILEITAVPFTQNHVGGGERAPSELMRELSKYEEVVGCFSMMDSDVFDFERKFIVPAKFVSIPPFITIHNPVPDFHTFAAIRKFLRSNEGEIEFIHIHNLRTAMSTTWLLLSGLMKPDLKYKIILTDHLARFFPFPKISSSFVDYYAAVSKVSEQQLQSYASRPSVILPPAVSSNFSDKSRSPPFEQRGIDLLFLGRILPQKRPDILIKFTEYLITRGHKGIKTVIAGRASDKVYLDDIEKTIRDKKLEPNISIIDQPSDEDLIPLFSSSKVNVLFSTTKDVYGKRRSHPELAPFTVIEAASCGTPSLLSDFPGAEEQVIHGKTGFIIDENDMSSALSILDRLISCEQVWNPMSFSARQFVLSERTFPIVTRNFVRFLNSIRNGEL